MATAPSAVTATWSMRLPGAGDPPAREDHTWTVDPLGHVAYLFGGRAGGKALDDLWAFDLATDEWTRLDPEGPAPAARFGHEAAWVRGHGLVVTLGQAGPTFFDDLWVFDPSTSSWRELPDEGAGPVPRYGSCSGVGPDGRLWISHGFTSEGARFFDTLAYDFDAEAWTDETPPDPRPVARCLHVCWWTDGGDFVLYGGQTTGAPALGDLWVLSGSQGGARGTWAKESAPDPASRHLPAVARRGDATFLFGGRDADRTPLGDLWLLRDDEGSAFERLQSIGAAPSPRSGAALIHDAPGDRMLLFGGLGDAELGDLWLLSFE